MFVGRGFALFFSSKYSTLPSFFFPSCVACWGGKESESDQEQEEEVIL
jgi:hypothetical protein